MPIGTKAGHAGAVFATRVGSNRDRSLADPRIGGVVVKAVFETVVGVEAGAAVDAEVILTVAVIVGNDVDAVGRGPFDLSAEARLGAETRVGLPAIDEPGFDLQVLRGNCLLYTSRCV